MTAPATTKSFILQNSPLTACNFDLGSPDATFKLEAAKPIEALKENQVLVKILYLSNDPTQRPWIQKGANQDRMYAALVSEGDVMRSLGLGKVIESKSSKYTAGDYITGLLAWEEYVTVDESRIFNKIADTSIPLTMYLDVIGLTGLTAYVGLIDVGKVTKDDTVVISAASGATGSMCVQIAKHIIGCKRVIGISGGAEKCKYVESIGADAAVDYKDPNFKQNLQKAIGGVNTVDVYFDSVGGKILDLMLQIVKPFGRIVACGAIAGYNDLELLKISNWGQIITNRLTVTGFICSDLTDQFPKAIADISVALKAGKVKCDASSFTLVDLTDDKFSKIPETWSLLFSDKKGPGKLITKIANDDA
ncbi:hypothetical protein BABINDRAFT_82736 [Babjeviella inositovora NRRL Y-12698]|uniref:Enoyl reductase (ER) domain-containing protein n=1 Tax=Babjeviella inositovora NRRL Y-12698 TaxID=984486 RepID=A0A1E3R018_9ASCO|nr:uncharacterized protein BABINDRAFT_82736 [Babjeviella inositovora NRRL Y-12698]ODQ83256.1 hypothetical protein BABINDRAFT_82736 [Babjeviella inositovora NRRL Y-12698]